MISKSEIGLDGVERFIRVGMREGLRRDLLRHKMLREADLAGCIYYRLRRLLKPDNRWRVFVNRYVKDIGRYPDLLLLLNKQPVIAIEVKWRSAKISGKDRDTLRACLKRLDVRKVYFVTTVILKSDYTKLRWQKKSDEKWKLRELTVALNLSGKRREFWESERGHYQSAFK